MVAEVNQNTLLEVGKWLEINGEAIYYTRPWVKFGEGPVADAVATSMVKLRAAGFAGKLNSQNMSGDGVGGGGMPRGSGYKPQDIRFTTHGDTLYATVMAWPAADVVITSLATGKPVQGKVEKVELLGHGGALTFTQDAEGLKVKFPADKPCDYAYALKITGLKLK